MEEIIKSIASKAGISADQSKVAVDSVLEIFKSKMPASLSGQLEGLLGGKSLDLSSVLKDSASDKLNDIKEGASEKLDDLKDSFKKLF
jgi:hypothetical protein